MKSFNAGALAGLSYVAIFVIAPFVAGLYGWFR